MKTGILRTWRVFISLITAAAVASGLYAENDAGAIFLNNPLSIRQVGMGNLSMAGTDMLRAWSNPAVLADQERLFELSMNGSSAFDGIESSFAGGAGLRFMPEMAVGLMVSSMSVGFPEIDRDGNRTRKDVGQDSMAVGMVVAGAFEMVRGGLGIKYVSESDPQGRTGAFSGVAIDVGVSAQLSVLRAGASIRNLGDLKQANAEGKVKLPMEERVGLAADLKPWPLKAGFEYVARSEYYRDDWGAGLEWTIKEGFGLRIGTTGLGYGYPPRYTAGFSAGYKYFGLDYSIATHPLGLTHQFNISVALGRKATEKAAEKAESPEEPRREIVEERRAAKPEPSQSSEILNVAVSELGAQNVSSGDAAVIADLIRSELVKSGVFNVVEKSNMDKILSEQTFQKTGCTSEECAVKLGKLLNVQRIIVGSFGKLLDKYFVNIRVVNVETGRVMFAENAKGRQVDDLEINIKKMVDKLVDER